MPALKRMDFSKFPRKVLPRHETLFVEGEDTTELYVMLSGALGVYRNEVQVATVEEPMSLVGEISALTKRPRNATVRALRVTTLVIVAEPDSIFEEYPRFGAKIARQLADRLATMNERFVDLKSALVRSSSGSEELGSRATLPIGVKIRDLTAAAAEIARGARTLAPPTRRRPKAAPAARKDPGAAKRAEAAEVGYAEDVMDALSTMLDWNPGS